MSKIAYPDSAEREYYRLLRAVARKLRQLTQEQMGNVKTALRRDEADSKRISEDTVAAFEMSGIKIEVMTELRRVMNSVDNTTKDNLRKSFRDCLQVDIFSSDEPLLSTVTSEWYAQQSKLVDSIVSTYTDKLGTIVSNAVQRGSLYKDVQADIKNLYDITDNRAKFIARNEIGNLNAVTTKIRQEAAGIWCYQWSTSKDERVRAAHVAMDGDYYYWSGTKVGQINGIKVYPAPKYHPGMDYNCRCVAIPIIDLDTWNPRTASPLGEAKPNSALELKPYEVKEFRFFSQFDDVPDAVRVRKSVIDLDADTGIKFIVPVTLNRKLQNLTKDKLLPQIATLPESLRGRIKQVRILDVYCPADKKWAELYKGFEHAYATAEEYVITFWRNNGMNLPEDRLREILLHEGGHLLDVFFGNISLKKKWLNAVIADTNIHGLPVTEYARNGPAEDFAESIMIYYTYGDSTFEKYYPNRHALLKEILKDD